MSSGAALQNVAAARVHAEGASPHVPGALFVCCVSRSLRAPVRPVARPKRRPFAPRAHSLHCSVHEAYSSRREASICALTPPSCYYPREHTPERCSSARPLSCRARPFGRRSRPTVSTGIPTVPYWLHGFRLRMVSHLALSGSNGARLQRHQPRAARAQRRLAPSCQRLAPNETIVLLLFSFPCWCG